MNSNYVLNRARFSALLVHSKRYRERDIPIVTTFKDVIWPPDGQRLLPEMPKAPSFYPEIGEQSLTTTRLRITMRGPELVHTDYIHKQYGVVALIGGMMQYKHFELTRKKINTQISDRMFAIWRVDPPWLPCTKLPLGAQMSNKKSPLHHYATPVRAGRVILEVGGEIIYDEARMMLGEIAQKLPFKAKFFSHDELLEKQALEQRLERENVNPFTWEYVMKWNMQNCSSWLSSYDYIWKGKYS